jgi:hypothetical protein
MKKNIIVRDDDKKEWVYCKFCKIFIHAGSNIPLFCRKCKLSFDGKDYLHYKRKDFKKLETIQTNTQIISGKGGRPDRNFEVYQKRTIGFKEYLNSISKTNEITLHLKNRLYTLEDVRLFIGFISLNYKINKLIIEQRFFKYFIFEKLIKGLKKYNDAILDIQLIFPSFYPSQFTLSKDNNNNDNKNYQWENDDVNKWNHCNETNKDRLFANIGEILMRNKEIAKQKLIFLMIGKRKNTIVSMLPKVIQREILKCLRGNSGDLIKQTKKRSWFEMIKEDKDIYQYKPNFDFSLSNYYSNNLRLKWHYFNLNKKKKDDDVIKN